MLPGFRLGDSLPDISLLQFADNTLCFLPAEESLIPSFICILRRFELVSSLRINYHKSALMGVHVPEKSISFNSNLMGCRVENSTLKCAPLCVK